MSGVAIDATDARPALESAVDGEGAADVVIDQPAIGEAQVGLEARDPRVAEPAAQRRHVAGQRGLDTHDRLAGERAERRRAHGCAAHRAGVARRDEEVRREAVVDHDRGLSAFQDGVQVNGGTAALDPVGRRQDESALCHAGSMRPRPAAVYAREAPAAAPPRPGRSRRARRGA
jgi:hypothetical protein